jgi:hypothetical protein
MLVSCKFYKCSCPQEWYHIPQVKSANLSLKMQVRARSEHNTKITVFMGKETLQNLLVRQFGAQTIKL